MSSERREHQFFRPYCLVTGLAGVLLLFYLTKTWPIGLPLFSYEFCLLAIFAAFLSTLGFLIGRGSLHVSLTSIFEMTMLLSFGPLVTIWMSAISFAGGLLLRAIDRVYICKLPQLRSWPEQLIIAGFTGGMAIIMWTAGSFTYKIFACQNCPASHYLFSTALISLVLVSIVNNITNSIFLAFYQKFSGNSLKGFFSKDLLASAGFEIATMPIGVLIAAIYQTMGRGALTWSLLILFAIGVLLRSHSNILVNLEERIADLRVLNRFGHSANTILNMDELLKGVYQETSSLFNASKFIIALFNPSAEELKVELKVENGESCDKESLSLNRGILGYIASNKKDVFWTSQMEWKKLQIPDSFPSIESVPESFLGVPIVIGEELLGVIALEHEKAQIFNENSRKLLITLADQLAGAIRNARLFSEMEGNFISMREINRMKDEFLNNISHELRTPLTVIMGWGELMSYSQLSEKQQKSAVDQINKSSLRLYNLVNSLLDLSKIEKGSLKLELKEININDPIKRAVDDNSIDASAKNIELTCELEDNLPKIMADTVRIQQAISNILNNAIKFTSSGGLVLIQSELVDNQLSISISDNGIGMDQSSLSQIFESFSQIDASTTRKYGGVGIGLTLVKKLIEMHGGKVMVESEAGKGSTFSILLPINSNVENSLVTSPKQENKV